MQTMTNEAWRAFAAAVREYGGTCGHCRICGAPAVYVGICVPNQEFGARIGAPKGKTRAIFYRVCEGCFHLPNVTELIETGILRDLQVQ
jgi:hypothetical protein